MTRLLTMMCLIGCVSKHQKFYKNYEPTESPCIDGTILNISNSTCNAVYMNKENEIIKLRCANADIASWWNASSFYVVRSDFDKEISPSWVLFCVDSGYAVFAQEYSAQLGYP